MSRVGNEKNLLLITFTMPEIISKTPPHPTEMEGYRQATLDSIRRLLRTKKNRNKEETNGVRHLLKGWFYAYEVKVTETTTVEPGFDRGYGLEFPAWNINCHVHMLAERRFWFYDTWLKEQAVKAGLGRVVNLKHVRKTPKNAVRYIVKYMLKDKKSNPYVRRYYETGGSFRQSKQ